jgi:RNA polymerase sigma-70 factor (ECF subfamily)
MNLCVQANLVGLFCAVGGEPAAASPVIYNLVNEQDNNVRDIELLRQIAAGDRPAFAEFYDRHSVLMFSVASRILNDPAEAEDVLQEVFMQIWEKAAKFDPGLGRAASWAAILVRNRAIDRIRSAQRRTRLAQEAGPELAFAAVESGTANEIVHGAEKAKLIQSAIEVLPADQRAAIELAYFSGLTHIEISEKLQEPLGTIKARIRRGLLKLREQLEGVV